MMAAAQPRVTWAEKQHDFGVILEENGKVTCQMQLVNSGDEPLLIVKAQASCGCTAVNYPQTPIQPGDSATVDITYNPSGRPGQFTKEVLIFTNAIPKRAILEITGNVIPTDQTLSKQYPLQAGSLHISQGNIPFGELVKGENKTLFLSAYNASTDTVLVHVNGDKPHMHPALVPDTVPPAMVTALTVHYLSGHAPQWGLNVDTLTLSCEPLRQPATALAGEATINVMAQVIENFSGLTDKQRQDAPVVSVDCGDRLDFGSIKEENEQVTRTFTITNKGKDPLIIRRLWIPDGEGFTVSANRTEIKRGKSATVTVTARAATLRGNVINVPLTVMSNDPETPRLTIRLVGINDQ
jgi:predicted hotdog family 3-hydroxylacyl-ACP dehydratase